MPIYEYQCKACGKVNEVMQKIGADAPANCDECSSGPLTKLLSKSGFILKGSGWYVTDFRGNGSGKAGGVPSPAKDDSGGSSVSDSKTETKTDTKTETKPKTESSSAGGCATGCGHNH